MELVDEREEQKVYMKLTIMQLDGMMDYQNMAYGTNDLKQPKSSSYHKH